MLALVRSTPPKMSDAQIRLREIEAGSQARADGKPKSSCPWFQQHANFKWWNKGYDHPIVSIRK